MNSHNNNHQNNFYQSQYPPNGYPYNYLNNSNSNPVYQTNNQNYNNPYWNYYQFQNQQQINYYQQYQQYAQNAQYQTNQNSSQQNFYNRNQTNFQNKNKNQNFSRPNNYNHQNRNQNFNKKNKSNKIDKRDLPENNKYYCEVCDRGFKTDDKYQEHLSTHRTCGINGCKFTAADKLVEIHYRNFHASGLDKKLTNLQTPEEIQKYINERKKNFPTKTNLDKKINLEKEKSERGVILNTKQFGRLKNKNYSNEQNKNYNSNINDTNTNKKVFKRNKNKKKSGLFARKVEVLKKRYKKPTLLQKLLANEIRHERNIVLQCVRYVVSKSFFENDQNSENKAQ